MALTLKVRDTVDPWYFPSPGSYQETLEAHEFEVNKMKLISRPTALPGDISGWFGTFAESFFSVVPDTDRDTIINEVRVDLRSNLCDSMGTWIADYVRLRFSAELD